MRRKIFCTVLVVNKILLWSWQTFQVQLAVIHSIVLKLISGHLVVFCLIVSLENTGSLRNLLRCVWVHVALLLYVASYIYVNILYVGTAILFISGERSMSEPRRTVKWAAKILFWYSRAMWFSTGMSSGKTCYPIICVDM